MQEIIGYILASLIGISLGLIGGGGSILTIPVLVLVMGIGATTATAYSLFIVGFTAFVGCLTYLRKGLVDTKIGIWFALPSLIAVFLVRKFLMPLIPIKIIETVDFTLYKDSLLMLIFAAIMLIASFFIIRDKKTEETKSVNQALNSYFFVFIIGLGVGVITGIVGVGGGFMIIPTLVLFLKLEMKKAVGTSLFIIAINSLLGFLLADLNNQALKIDWKILITFSVVASGGIFVGSYLSNWIAGEKLKKGFGYFVLVMACYILIHELFITNKFINQN
ncbi:permease [bacterium 336/3]|nr:permease [bacterium 336/3]